MRDVAEARKAGLGPEKCVVQAISSDNSVIEILNIEKSNDKFTKDILIKAKKIRNSRNSVGSINSFDMTKICSMPSVFSSNFSG